MAYYLGIDLGTTYTAAAVWRDGRVEIANLGTRAPVVPSVVLLRDDGTILTGEAAERRAVTEPQRVAREFKRRVGDPTPIIVGGTPYSADSLTARLLRWVVDSVSEREGGAPDGVVVSHPANWGPFKQDLLRQAMRLADLAGAATITEPEAAAIHYASQERVEPGEVVAVYDLGGGTFDAAVLRRDASGWQILGEPEGVERLGGVDFDQAVFHHVQQAIGDAVDALDPDDPAAVAALARLRRECVEAKEALAGDVDVVIPVLLPNLQTDVRLTRAEFEAMIRPTLVDSIGALRRALRSAEVGPEDVTTVLLVGGSSRIPLVAQLVGSELGRPVAVDAHPKHGVALGAAVIAAEQGTGRRVDTQVVPVVDAPAPVAAGPGVEVGGPLTAAAAAGAGGAALGAAAVGDAGPAPVPGPPTAPTVPATPGSDGSFPSPAPGPAPVPGPPTAPTVPAGPVADASSPAPARAPGPPGPTSGDPYAAATQRVTVPAPAPAPVGPGGPGRSSGERPTPSGPRRPSGAGSGGGRRTGVLVAAGVLVVAAVAAGALLLPGGGDDDGGEASEVSAPPLDPGSTEGGGGDPTADTTEAPAPTTEPPPAGPTVLLDSVELEGGRYRAHYTITGYEPADAPGALHTHFFLDTTQPGNAGTNGAPPGDWELTYESGSLLTEYGPDNRGDASQLCVTVADHDHGVVDGGNYDCRDLPS